MRYRHITLNINDAIINSNEILSLPIITRIREINLFCWKVIPAAQSTIGPNQILILHNYLLPSLFSVVGLSWLLFVWWMAAWFRRP